MSPTLPTALVYNSLDWRKFIALKILCFVGDLLFCPHFAYCFGKITYFYFSYLINCYYVALLYSLILKNVLLKFIWLHTSFGCNLNFDKVYAPQVSIHVAASHKAYQHQTLISQIQIVGPHAILAWQGG